MERALLSLAADRRPVQGGGDDDRAGHSAEWDTLAAPDWPGVPEKAMLLSPSRCRDLWRQFISDTNLIVQQVSLAAITVCLPDLYLGGRSCFLGSGQQQQSAVRWHEALTGWSGFWRA